jgi:hypothetical protein
MGSHYVVCAKSVSAARKSYLSPQTFIIYDRPNISGQIDKKIYKTAAAAREEKIAARI